MSRAANFMASLTALKAKLTSHSPSVEIAGVVLSCIFEAACGAPTKTGRQSARVCEAE